MRSGRRERPGRVARDRARQSDRVKKFLHAGPGYGGSCFPKDTLALLKTAEDFEVPVRIVEAVVSVNDTRKRAMGRKIIHALADDAKGKTVAVFGLTFKPNTDDMRDAPSLAIVQSLLDAGATVRAYDPEGMDAAKAMMPDITYCSSAYEAATGADAVAIVTEWDTFRALDLKRLAGVMAAPVMVDLRNIYRPEDVKKAGFRLFVRGALKRSKDETGARGDCVAREDDGVVASRAIGGGDAVVVRQRLVQAVPAIVVLLVDIWPGRGEEKAVVAMAGDKIVRRFAGRRPVARPRHRPRRGRRRSAHARPHGRRSTSPSHAAQIRPGRPTAARRRVLPAHRR